MKTRLVILTKCRIAQSTKTVRNIRPPVTNRCRVSALKKMIGTPEGYALYYPMIFGYPEYKLSAERSPKENGYYLKSSRILPGK